MQTRRGLLLSTLAATVAAAAKERPNIVFILLDDLRWDELGCTGHPFVKTPNIDRIAREGVLFRNAFVTTPLCSPSRASFLTGLYAHSHRIVDNTEHDALSHQLKTFPQALQKAGYENGFVGKWHMGTDDTPRPGFDYWVSFRGQGNYLDPEINVNGRRAVAKGYMTDILTDRAIDFLKKPRSKPFLLYVPHKAVHPELKQNPDGSVDDPNGGIFIPAERHKSLYSVEQVPRRPNANRTPEGKPALQRKIDGVPPLGAATGTSDETIRNRLRMLQAVEEGVGRMLRTLEETRQLDRTVLVFTSDEGYFYGEHGLSFERRLAYEESARIPLLMRYPRLIRRGSTIDGLVLNIDLAPTLLDLAGVATDQKMHGRSLLPLIKGNRVGWRTSFLIEHSSDKVFPRGANMGYKAVRTERWKYIQYVELAGMDELYDLKADPYEMKNLITDSGSQKALRELRKEMKRLLDESGA